MTMSGSGLKLRKSELFKMLGYTPHAGQVEIHKSKAPRRIVACGVRFGKTKLAAMEGIAAALQPTKAGVGWVVGPTYDLADRVFREIQVVLLEHMKHRIEGMRESERRIFLRNLGGGISEIRAKSADNPVSLLGEGLDWLVIDEASRMKPTIWQSHLSQRLIDKKGWALLISTPKGKGYFFDLFQRAKQGDLGYASWNMPSWANPMLDKAIIDQERERLPERVFKQEYGAEFIEGAGAVFSNVRECATGEWVAPVWNKNYWAGLDLARVQDYTVLTIMDWHRQVMFVDRFHKLDWDTQVARVKGHLRRYNNARCWVDSTGKGDPVVEALRKAGINVYPYLFTTKSKADLINSLVLTLEQRLITLPKPQLWPEGVDELEAFQYSVSESGHVRTAAPGNGHDDCVISLALAVWDRRPTRDYVCRITPL